jgi:hypothetical protein
MRRAYCKEVYDESGEKQLCEELNTSCAHHQNRINFNCKLESSTSTIVASSDILLFETAILQKEQSTNAPPAASFPFSYHTAGYLYIFVISGSKFFPKIVNVTPIFILTHLLFISPAAVDCMRRCCFILSTLSGSSVTALGELCVGGTTGQKRVLKPTLFYHSFH